MEEQDRESPQYVSLCNGLARLMQVTATLGVVRAEFAEADEPALAGTVRRLRTEVETLTRQVYERAADRAADEAGAEEAPP